VKWTGPYNKNRKLAFCAHDVAAGLHGALQQGDAPAEGQVLHILVNKSVVINLQAPLKRVLTSNRRRF